MEHPTPPRPMGPPFRKIVVTLDGTEEAAEALGPASALASQLGAELCLVHVLEDGGAPSERDLAATYLAGVAGQIEERARVVATVVRSGQMAEEIVGAARELGADLVVMATQGRHGLARAWLGSVAEGVLAASPVPVLLTRPGARQPERLRTILVAVDGTPGGALALATAARLARGVGAALVLLEVVVPVPDREDPAIGPLHLLLEGLSWEALTSAAARQYVDRLSARLMAAGLEAQARVAVGPIAATIERVAGEVGADLIVMSTHALTGAARAVVGSVADEVVRTAQRPVLLVRRPERHGFDVPRPLAATGQMS